jgi:hypothetical protein
MWAIGNGESRSLININHLQGEKVGCNAIMRDYYVDRLVCVDRRMIEEALNKGVNTRGTLVYTRPDWYPRYKTLKVRELPPLPYEGNQRWDEPFQWGSGPYAVLIAAMFAKEHEVNLIGFDLYSKTKTVNNVYKDTQNYDASDKRAVDPRYWIHQIGMVFKCFPKIKFTIYQYPNWELPKAWNYPNVKVDRLSSIAYNTYYDKWP